MSDQAPPKEWWIAQHGLEDYILHSEPFGTHSSKFTHVIEKSAYIGVVAELDRSEHFREKIEKERDEWRAKAMDVEKHPVVVLLRQERDSARAENERLMNVEYWPERARAAEKKLADRDAEIWRLRKGLSLALYYVEGDATYEGLLEKLKGMGIEREALEAK